MEAHDHGEDHDLRCRLGEHIDIVEGALLEKTVFDHFRGNEYYSFRIGQRVGADEAHDLLKPLLAFQELQGLDADGIPLGIETVPPGANLVGVFRVGFDPADGRIMPGVGEVAVKRPETADKPFV